MNTTEDLCPECDHDGDEHDAAGCREWTPAWPRLVRCACRLPYANPNSELTEGAR